MDREVENSGSTWKIILYKHRRLSYKGTNSLVILKFHFRYHCTYNLICLYGISLSQASVMSKYLFGPTEFGCRLYVCNSIYLRKFVSIINYYEYLIKARVQDVSDLLSSNIYNFVFSICPCRAVIHFLNKPSFSFFTYSWPHSVLTSSIARQ